MLCVTFKKHFPPPSVGYKTHYMLHSTGFHGILYFTNGGTSPMVTLKDIAAQAGVSVMTVSRVVNGHQSKVSEDTRNRILSIIKETGYVPNYSARSLSSNSSHIIAIIIRGEGSKLTDVYNSTMLGSMISYIQEHGYFVMTHYVNDYREISKLLHVWNAEGAILLGVFDENIQEVKEDNRIPIVFTDSYSSLRQITNIGIDDYKGGCLAAEHFIQNGHTDMAFIGTETAHSGVCQNRLKGFQDTIEKHGLKLPAEHILDCSTTKDLCEEILAFPSPVTAVFCNSDNIAIDLMDRLSQKGFQIPDTYSIISFDNFPLGYYVNPKITPIAQDIDPKAADSTAPSENIILDVKLISRNSVKDRKKN